MRKITAAEFKKEESIAIPVKMTRAMFRLCGDYQIMRYEKMIESSQKVK